MLDTDLKLERMQRTIDSLRSRLERAREHEVRLREVEKRYQDVLQTIDSRTREIHSIRATVNMPQLYLDEDLNIVGHSSDFLRLTPKVVDYARDRTYIGVLFREDDIRRLREYLDRVRALEELPYDEGAPWELRYSGPGPGDEVGGRWIDFRDSGKWEISGRGKRRRIFHHPHREDRMDCCLLSAEEYGGPEEDVRLVFKTRTSAEAGDILDHTCFISASSGREMILPDTNGYTVCLGSNYNTLGRIQKHGADVVSRQERIEPDTEYLVEVERIGGRITRRVRNLSTGEDLPLLYYVDFNAIYGSENHVGFYTYSGQAEFRDIEIYTRPSRFGIEQFTLPFSLEAAPRGHGLEDRCFELTYVRNEETGKSLHTLIFNDITSRREQERQLRESEEKYRKLFEEGRVARSTTTPDGRFIDVNAEMERMTGYSRQELYALDAHKLYVDPVARHRYLEQLERDSYVRDYELQFRRKDGTVLDCMITSSIHPATDGSEYFIQGTIHDVTERKRMEAKLKESQKMEVIGRIASGVAHEVRNPLNAILAISEALSEEIGDEETYRPYMDHICGQVDRLSTLMKDLLELGKPLKTTEFAVVSLHDICRGAVELWLQSSSEKNARVELVDRTGDTELPVFGNSSKLKQVLLNLLENAAQHSPEGEPVGVELALRGEDEAAIRVVDRGSGIPSDVLPEVFKPFFTTRARGSGLGLSIVRNIVETHGGAIELLNNDPPPGLRVEVSLPLCRNTGGEEHGDEA